MRRKDGEFLMEQVPLKPVKRKKSGSRSDRHPLDENFCESVLEQAIMDLKEFGVKFKASRIPVMETWIALYRQDDIFKGFVLARQKGANRLERRIFVKTAHTAGNALVLHFKNRRLRKERFKIRMPIKRARRRIER